MAHVPLARSIREGVEMLRIKKKSSRKGAREIGDSGRRSGAEGCEIGTSDCGLGARTRGRARTWSIRRSGSISSSGERGVGEKEVVVVKSNFASVVSSSHRPKFVSPQGRKKAMGWMRKIAGPLRRAWDIVSCRQLHHAHKRSRGMGRLYNDVRSCGYDDVHLMWSMLQSSQTEAPKWRRFSRRQSRAQR